MVKALSVYTAILDVCEISALCLQCHTLLESTFINGAFSSVNARSVCVRAPALQCLLFFPQPHLFTHTLYWSMSICYLLRRTVTAVFISAVKSVGAHTPKHLSLLHKINQPALFPSESENKNIYNSDCVLKDLMKSKLDLFADHLY